MIMIHVVYNGPQLACSCWYWVVLLILFTQLCSIFY